jgi:predicted metal-dependent phosphoesterase TrpH
MKIDFHVHAAMSKEIPFDLDLFHQTLEAARLCGLEALALTDHFDSPNFEEVHRTLEREFDYVGLHYLANGIKLLLGLEFEVGEGPHLLVVSDRDSIFVYQQRLRRVHRRDGACSARVFFDRQEELELLTIFGHPFRPNRDVSRIEPDLYTRFDALELNARDLYFHGADMRARTAIFARTHGIPVVAGSDAHHYHQIGSVYNQFEAACHTLGALKSSIADGAYGIRIDEVLGEKVAAARRAKKLLKARAPAAA